MECQRPFNLYTRMDFSYPRRRCDACKPKRITSETPSYGANMAQDGARAPSSGPKGKMMMAQRHPIILPRRRDGATWRKTVSLVEECEEPWKPGKTENLQGPNPLFRARAHATLTAS